MVRLEFNYSCSYEPTTEGIPLPVVLRSGAEVVDLLAFIDTGAAYCLFAREHGEMLNLDIETGEPKSFQTANSRVEAFGHIVRIEAAELEFEAMVYFFADQRIHKNLLGRTGWLNRVRFGLIEHDQQLFLASYDFEAK